MFSKAESFNSRVVNSPTARQLKLKGTFVINYYYKIKEDRLEKLTYIIFQV
jgi:hypothetical protein